MLRLDTGVYAVPVDDLIQLIVGQTVQRAAGNGLAGVGDLEVTGLSGRNKVYGLRIGRGEPAQDALAAMVAAEQTVEGVPAAGLALELVQQLGGDALLDELPLLKAVASILEGGDDPAGLVTEAVLPKV